MKVSIQEGCIGCGLCAGSCPKVFRMGADGTAEVVAPVPDIKEESIRMVGYEGASYERYTDDGVSRI